MNETNSVGEKLNAGAVLFSEGKFTEAIKLFEETIKLNPKLAVGYFNLALSHQRLGEFEKAIEFFRKTLKLKPDDDEAKSLLAENYYKLGEFEKAIKFRPNYPEALTNLGAIYARDGKFTEALECYQKSLELNENYPTTYVLLGNIFLAQGNMDDAIMCYKMAVEKDSKNAEALNNLGTAYARLQKYGNAIKYYKKALPFNKNSESTLSNLAMTYASVKKTPEALKYFKMAFEKYPENGMVAANYFYQKREAADWDGIEMVEKKLNEITDREIKLGVKPGEDPFTNVIRDENPKRNLELAELWSADLAKNIHQKTIFKFDGKKGKKINVGYISAHFHNHPTTQLISKLFETHDKNKFNIFVYSLGPNDKSSYYKKIAGSVHKFTDLYNTSFSDSALKIHKDKIDILVDLDGYTDNNKLQILALKPGKIQVTYLGFPGTTGASFIDYIIADRVVIPKINEEYFSEKVLYMPNSYQVNDNSQKISVKLYQRKDFALPEKAIVFASFNGTYKIEPKAFDIWMRILRKVPSSTLWLLKTNDLAEKNLKNEAKNRGIDPKRLIFSGRLPKGKHLARLALADIALDTFTCNGHTSTSDALWAGLPVITLEGSHFASRVSASLLKAVGHPELITHSPKEYEDLAVSLAKSRSKLSALRSSLFAERLTEPLFNTQMFAKDLEEVFRSINK